MHYGELKMELPIPIYILWIVALRGLAGTIFCAIGDALARAGRCPTPGHAGMSPSLIGAIGVAGPVRMLLICACRCGSR